jgi:starch phosphorylase
MEIIQRINEEFLATVRAAYPGDELRARRMSIISDYPYPAVRMAHLATVAATKVNGVAELHSQLLRDKVLPDFSALWPEKFTNVTNGVTPRRFIQMANGSLARVITEAIGDGWVTDLEQLRGLEPYAVDPAFQDAFRAAKQANKERFYKLALAVAGIELPDGHLIDVMVKRLHEYKRQLLKVLHVVSTYEGLMSGRIAPESVTPRIVAFGAKAAPGYHMAKEIIFLINRVSAVINAEPRMRGRLYVGFAPNYNVTLAEKLIPAADLSEQISLAGKEASGTGNMKFALNGALTIGTDDGANVEIRQLVGDDNFFLFGLREPEVAELQARGYVPSSYYESVPTLRSAIDLIASGHFTDGNRDAVGSIVGDLLYNDRFLVLADFESYLQAQGRVDAAYRDQAAWTRSAILNVARSGYFSSDRSMRDYIDRVWGLGLTPQG